MRNVSNLYIETMEERRDFYPEAEINFANGIKKTLRKDEFEISGNTISDSAGSSSFPLGILLAKSITISIINDDERWSEYDFYWAKIFLQTKYDLDNGTTETLNIGTFTVITPESYGETITITAMDDSYKADIDYDTKLVFPMSAGIALRDSCKTCGITLLTTTFKNDSYVISQKPEHLTHRQFIGMCAMLAGGNARFDEYNRLVIKHYDLLGFRSMLDGGRFSPWTAGENINGGSFVPWTAGEPMDGGSFGDRNSIHVLYQFKSGLRVDVDDVVITGVQIVDADGNAHLFGTEGYVLSLENQLAAGKEDEAVNLIGKNIVGIRFRPFSGEHISLPTAEFMDLAYIIDRKNNIYQTVLTDVDFTYFGFTSLKCAADSPIRNSSTYYGNETKAIVQARQMVSEEKTEREKAVENLANQLAKSSGLYITAEKQQDGSTIYYMHDKSTLAESMIVWKLTAQAFGISTDGGKTYPYGLDATGTAILSRIYAIGLDASYIDVGTLTVGGKDHANMSIIILDSKGNQIGKWDKDGINATKGTFSGALDAATGHIGGWTITDTKIYGGDSDTGVAVMQYPRDGMNWVFAAGGESHGSYGSCPFRVRKNGEFYATNAHITGDGTFSGKLSAATGTFAGNLSAAGGTFNGELKAATGTFSGNLSAAGGTFTGTLSGVDGNFSGTVNATNGNFSNVTINGCTLQTNSMTGTLSGGTYSSPSISGGTLSGSTGGTYVGNCNGSTLSNCSLGSSSLSTGNNGSFSSPTSGYTHVYGGAVVEIEGGGSIVHCDGIGTTVTSSLTVKKEFNASGTKHRVIKTQHFGNRCLSAFETPSPTFSDYGKAALDDNGECFIVIDSIFSETVNNQYEPTVFLTKYGQGDIWVDDERTTHDIIVVCGTPGLKFAWETRYQQINCYQERMHILDFDEPDFIERNYAFEADMDAEFKEIDYAEQAADYLYNYELMSVKYADEAFNYFIQFEGGLTA